MNRFLRQARGLLIYSWNDFFAYRGYLLFWVSIESLFFFAMYFLWIYIYKGQQNIASYTLATIITYYFVVYFVKQFTVTYYDWNMMYKINNGKFSQYLFRPLTHKMYYFFDNIGEKSVRLLVLAPFLLLMLYLVREYLIPTSLVNLALMIIAVLISFILNTWLCFTVGTVGFWTEKADSIIYFKDSLVYYLSGAMIPLSFFGKNLETIFTNLPFRYLVSFPVEIYLSRLSASEILYGIVVGIIWILVFVVLERVLFFYGIKRYSAVGN